jgi:hypothetical protein
MSSNISVNPETSLSVFGHLMYAFGVGTMIVLRSIGSQFFTGPAFSVLLFVGFMVSLFTASRLMLRIRRT